MTDARLRRTVRGLGGAVALGMALLGLVAGCTGAEPKPPSGTSTGPASPSSAVPTGLLPVVEAAGLAWQDWGESAANGFGVQVDVVSVKYRVAHTMDSRVVVVRRRSDDAVVVRHRTAGPGWVTVFADFAGDTLVLVDEDIADPSNGVQDPAQAFVYDLVTGQRTRVSSIAGAPPASVLGAQATVTDDGRYIYSASVKRDNDENSNCVGMVNLVTMQGSVVECAGEKDGFFVFSAEDGAAWLNVAGPTMESCRTGRGLRGSTLVTVGPADGCATVGATMVGGWSVWSATPVSGQPLIPDLSLFASDGQHTVELGKVDGTVQTTCGGFVYWRISDRATQTVQLRRWRPGLDHVEIAYTVKTSTDNPGAYSLGLGGCADDIVTLQVTSFAADGNTRVRVLTLDSRQ